MASYTPTTPTAPTLPNNFTNFNFTELILSQPIPWENRPGSIIGITMAIMVQTTGTPCIVWALS